MNALEIVQKYFPEVTKVVDAKESITIEVTDKDNKSAFVRNHKACAMAVACKKKEHADGVIVSISKAYVIKGSTATRYTVPEHATREIVSFDRSAGFSPGEYKLLAPTFNKKLGSHTGAKSVNTGKGGKIKRHPQKTVGIRTVLGSGLQ
jgi:hypothetical protein